MSVQENHTLMGNCCPFSASLAIGDDVKLSVSNHVDKGEKDAVVRELMPYYMSKGKLNKADQAYVDAHMKVMAPMVVTKKPE